MRNRIRRQRLSGHYHPKHGCDYAGVRYSRAAFLYDDQRPDHAGVWYLYRAGCISDASVYSMMGPRACAILTGPQPTAIPHATLSQSRGGIST